MDIGTQQVKCVADPDTRHSEMHARLQSVRKMPHRVSQKIDTVKRYCLRQ